MKFDYVIVGAGFAGSVFARRAAEADKKVLVIEKSNHIGGNAYDHYNQYGILVHKYGPHIFHTNSQLAWEYLSRFTQWNLYHHRVLGNIDGKLVPIPFNLVTLHELLPATLAEKLEKSLISNFGIGVKVPILKLRQTNDDDLKFLADFVYEKVFLNYTVKQWGMKPEELDSAVTGRVPIYISKDSRYFQDRYQGLPKDGFTNMFANILDHPNIHLLLNTDYKEVIDDITYEKLVYTGPVDYFFDYKFGQLPYRSVDFKFETFLSSEYQPVGTVNYPNDYDYTRITEFKHMTGQKHEFTATVAEFPKAYDPVTDIPYYPVPKPENADLYSKYQELARSMKNVLFVGRLAEYRYYNMDAVVDRVLELTKNL